MERERALDMALGQIEKQFGKGAIMRMGDDAAVKVAAIPTGALSLDLALGIGGLPRGRVVELYGPESSGKTTVALHAIAEAQKAGGIAAFIDAEHALDPTYAKALGVDVEALLVSQPDTGEQALEITDMLVRSGAVDIVVIDSVAALTPRAEIEGEMGDSHVGLQARLMSQALRKLAGTLNRSKTCAIFINQLREKIGVMFGCMTGDTRVTLADGTQEPIGTIVNQRRPVEVLSYDPDRDEIVARRVTNWFDNGPTEEFLEITVARGDGDGRARFACTPNHLVRTPAGWREAQDLRLGDRVLRAVAHHLSPFQWEVLLGGLMADSTLAPTPDGHSVRLRWQHAARQAAYGDWKAALFANVAVHRTAAAAGRVSYETQPLPELAQLHDAVYLGGRKVLSHDYLKRLTPLSLAIWYAEAGTFAPRAHGGDGRCWLSVAALEPSSRTRLARCLRDTWGVAAGLSDRQATAVLDLPAAATARFHELVAPYLHPSVQDKLLPRFRGRFAVEPVLGAVRNGLLPLPVTGLRRRPSQGGTEQRFDLEVEGTHNYFVDGVMVHNSPETTPGGRALKFYSSVRLDVRRIESLKDGTDSVGNRVRVKVVKNKCLAAGTRVFDPTTGTTYRIEEIVDRGAGGSVWAVDKAGKLHVRPIVARFNQGAQEVLTLTLQGGGTLRVTPDHRVLTEHGWKQAGELTTGDRLARPRRAGSFGEHRPVPVDHARKLGSLIGDGREERIPAAFFAADVADDVVANLLSGIFEGDGWVAREQTGGLRCGFSTTSEQLAQQIHWLLLRWGIASHVGVHSPGGRRNAITGRPIGGRLPCYEVRISGIDNARRFADALPGWGPRGRVLRKCLADPGLATHRGSQMVYLPRTVTAAVLAYLERRGVTPRQAAQIIGDSAGDPQGGMRAVLGAVRLRRDRLGRLAEGLDSPFLREVLAEDVAFVRVTSVGPREWADTYDIEVAELHTLVADDVVVHNCAAPFKQAEFDILFGEGISKEGSILDVGVEHGIVKKAGAWYTYEGEQLGQGRENARKFLREHDDVTTEIYKKVTELLGLVPTDVTGDDSVEL